MRFDQLEIFRLKYLDSYGRDVWSRKVLDVSGTGRAIHESSEQSVERPRTLHAKLQRGAKLLVAGAAKIFRGTNYSADNEVGFCWR